MGQHSLEQWKAQSWGPWPSVPGAVLLPSPAALELLQQPECLLGIKGG